MAAAEGKMTGMRSAQAGTAEIEVDDVLQPDHELFLDPRWQLIERIARSEAFQKSTRLPPLLRYLARCTIEGDREGLTETRIGHFVFHKREDYTPAEDSSVRVYVRQLRLRLHEYYHSAGQHETLIVDIPKGGYSLSFTHAPSTVHAGESPRQPNVAEKLEVSAKSGRPLYLWLALATTMVAMICAIGWYRTAAQAHRADVPWPLNQFVGPKIQTTVVLADVGYSLRMLGDNEVPIDQYVDRTYLKQVLPEHPSPGEARLLHYLAVSQTTSMADAHAVSILAQLAGPFAQNLSVRSARELSPNDLTRGNLIFVGAPTSNPWVQLYEDRLTFVFMEDFPGGRRYITNRKPRPHEQTTYTVPESTGSSGDDYATIALIPNRESGGNILIVQGLRMEGTEAAMNLLLKPNLRQELQDSLTKENHGHVPQYFEALLRAQSVAGAPVSASIVSLRTIQP